MSAELIDYELEPTPMDEGPYPLDIYKPAGYVMPRAYRPYYRRILNLPIRDDDIWVTSHPKCGTTWTSEMTWLIRHDADFEGAKQRLYERVPFLDYTCLLFNCIDEGEREKQEKQLPLLYSDSVGFVDQMPKSNGPRIIKSHLHWDFLPIDFKRSDCKGKIIYVARDPKDVCVSFYHHHKSVQSYSGSFEENAEHFLNDRLMYAPIWKHALEYWEQRDRQNILFIKYSDMKRDLPSVLREVRQFLNLAPLSEDKIKKLNDHLSVKSMQKNAAVNYTNIISSLNESGKMNEAAIKVRKGIVGDWKEYMSPELARRFEERTNKELAGSGLSF